MNFIAKILSNYYFSSKIIEIKPYGFGRINSTYMITCEDENQFILQRINTQIFPNVEALMQNIDLVTTELCKKAESRGESTDSILKIVKTKNDALFVKAEQGSFRLMDFIENSNCYQSVTNQNQMLELGKAIGKFHLDLYEFDSSQLYTTIPNFHNTYARLQQFYDDYENIGLENRIHNALPVIKNCLSKKDYSRLIVSAKETGKIPIRVAHNDTKLNNVLFDKQSQKAKCLIDFDTIMPDTILYDVGDAVRNACNMANEDECNLEVVKFNKEYYQSFMKGYLSEMGGKLNETEKELLPYAPIVMSYELGLRFLNDYIIGDQYFGVQHEDDNLNRAKVQFKMLEELENSLDFMKEVVNNELNSASKTIY